MDLNDKKVAYALTTLRSSGHFQTVKAAIREDLDRKLAKLPYHTDTTAMRLAQGACIALRKVLQDIDNAADAYEKMQGRGNG